MGSYTTRSLTKSEAKDVIETIRNGYLNHKPNPQVACILVLESNLGCRIGDITKLRTDSFVKDGDTWKINITEEKTGKKRTFIVAPPVMKFIQKWIDDQGILRGDRLFNINSPAVWKQLRSATDYLGYEDVSSHSFRKSASMRIYESTGHDIEAVREFLQHSSVTTTQSYIRRSSDQLEKAILSSVEIL